MSRRRKPRSVGGGGARNPRSLANLRRGVTAAPVGNRQAMRHGGYATVAREKLDAKARVIFEALSDDAPLRADDGGLPTHDAAMVRLLADCLCRLDSLGDWLDGRWATPEARPALELEARLRTQAADFLDAMGMTPRSRAKLGLDVRRAGSFDLARQWADEDVIDGEATDA